MTFIVSIFYEIKFLKNITVILEINFRPFLIILYELLKF